MADNITSLVVEIKVQSAQALADLKNFAAQTGASLKTVEQGGGGVNSELTQMRQSAFALHEGFRTLELGVYLLGGQRFPQLAMGIMGVRSAMMLTRSVAMLTGATMAATSLVLGTLTLALAPTAIAAWGAYKAKQDETRSSEELLNQQLAFKADLLKRINELERARLITMMQAEEFAKRAEQGDRTLTKDLIEALGGHGASVEQISALANLKKVEQDIHEESLKGFEGERIKAKEELDKRLADIEEFAHKAGPLLAPSIPGITGEGGFKLMSNPSDMRVEQDTEAAYAAHKAKLAEIAEKEKKASDERIALKQAELDKVVELQRRELALKQEIARSDLETKLAGIQQNPLLTAGEKAGQSVPVIQDLVKANDDYIKQLQERAALTTDDDAYLEIEKEISAEKLKQVKLGYDLQAAQGQGSIGFQFGTQWTAMSSQVENLAHDMATMAMSPFVGMKAGLASAFDTLLEKGSSFKQFMGTVALSIGHSMIQAFSDMVANFIMSHIVMKGVAVAWNALMDALGIQSVAWHIGTEAAKTGATGTAAGVRAGIRTGEAIHDAGMTGTQVVVHAAGEGAKTGATGLGALGRGAIRVGETIFHGINVGIRVVAHAIGETVMTAASLIGSVARLPLIAAETLAYVVMAGVAALAALAAIPIVGPFIAPAVALGILAMGISMMAKAFAAGGRPMVGQLALVGERGPELWVPDSAGTIIPHAQTAAMLRGGGGRGMGGDGGGSQGGSKTNLSVYNFSDPRQLADHFEKNGDLEKHIVDVMGRNIHRFR